MGKNIVKNLSKDLHGKYSPGMLAMFGNKIANKIMRVSKNPQQNNSETVTNEHDQKMPKERYISPEERQEIIDDLRLK